jgi:hypothetical protein
MSNFDNELKEMMRLYLATSGVKVDFEERWGNLYPNVWGWEDSNSVHHMRPASGKYPGDGCYWVVPEGSVVKEETYSQFDGTGHCARYEVGINVEHVDCACGKYKDVTIRVTASLGEAIQQLLNYDPAKEMKL